MTPFEYKQKIISKLNSVEDIYLLQKVMETLQPRSSKDLRRFNKHQMEKAREIDEDLKYGKSILRIQLIKKDPELDY